MKHEPMRFTLGLEVAGITLDLTVRISSEGFQSYVSAPAPAESIENTTTGTLVFDPQPLMHAVQQMLVQGLESLRGNLAEQALAILGNQIDEQRRAREQSTP
ncbi:hypothetical protein QO209_10760 [Pseudomonas citronellolis]|uniref:hypothetical protein n=1 Tax=Pseudomonas citronellolis TaxID=53408 RepID=UPI002647F86F|nr:hypothetical protein [Pseudomonas citronellolis]MDN6872926.1 hypothetical protein [Pseudomonas citronellolis]